MNNDVSLEKNQLFEVQLQRLNELKQVGINPFGHKFERNGLISFFKNNYEEHKFVQLAGRITALRDMGKTRFWDITDVSGRIQLFINPNYLNKDDFNIVPKLGIGDIIGIKGTLFKTKTEEISVKTENLTLLSKALRPLPEKYHGLKDVESRFRQRYLDLISNETAKKIFINRSIIVKTIRETLDDCSFLEVETPMLQPLQGGALAKPFITHHNALGADLFLRIAPELYLKRLLVGGLEKVYELNRNFRNEGLSRKHNPEFTMLEVYSAYDNYKDMMELCEKLIKKAAVKIGIEDEFTLPSGNKASINVPFEVITLFEAVKKYSGLKLENWDDLRSLGEKERVQNWEKVELGVILVELFEKYVEEKLITPTFVTHFPSVLSPLAKKDPSDERLSERFELYIDGQEIANAYSELNDPIEQKLRFEEQILNAPKDETAKEVDIDYIKALEHGMPPAGGLGIGIDRLVMILTGAPSIREVILFPVLKREE